MSDTLDHCLEICKLIKFSPRRDSLFSKNKNEMTPLIPGLRKLCPTRSTVRAASLQSIRENYTALNCHMARNCRYCKKSEMKARINGVAAKMKDFDFLFCFMLGEKLLKHCDNLNKTIQATSMPAVEARRLSELCVLQEMRTDHDFEMFWALRRTIQQLLNVSEPVLKRNRKRPRR